MMSLEDIRKFYCVPAKRGARVVYTGGIAPSIGTITGSNGARIRVRMDGTNTTHTYHPTWEMRYLEDAKQGSAAP